MGFQWTMWITMAIVGFHLPPSNCTHRIEGMPKQQGHFYQIAVRKIWYFLTIRIMKIWMSGHLQWQWHHGGYRGEFFVKSLLGCISVKSLVMVCLCSSHTSWHNNLLRFRLGILDSGLTHSAHPHHFVVFWIICVVFDVTSSVLAALYCIWPLDPCCF